MTTTRRARPDDVPAARALVAAAGLPLDGFDKVSALFVADDAGTVVGTVALEQHGTGTNTAFLLRSAAVDPRARGRGIGASLVGAALRHVDALRAPVALLTEGARDYFTRFRFQPVTRGALPAALAQSARLQGVCPDTADVLLRPAAAAATTDQPRASVTGPSEWRAADLANARAWTIELDDRQRAEITGQAEKALAAGRTVDTLRADDLPLPSVRSVVEECVTALTRGRGFVLLRGFPTDGLSPEAVELGYVGLGLQLGTPVGQDARGSLLGHVRDERVPRTGPHIRLYQTHERQDFHTDGADIVGLLCLRRARSGGESRLASTHALYNHILEVRPDLLEVLYQPFAWDRNDEQPAGDPPYFLLPAIHDIDGIPRIFYIGWYIRDAQRHPGAPRLTPEQLAAMQLIEKTANDPAFHVEMDFQPGDIQLIANWNILHAREAYRDADDPAERRHLLRLWLQAHDFVGANDLLREGIAARSGRHRRPRADQPARSRDRREPGSYCVCPFRDDTGSP